MSTGVRICMGSRLPSRRCRVRAGGFTMVELLIAMVAGLAVVLSVVALGRDATTNFHQEMKVASAQMTQRMAAQRLRSDLERTGFMATGNMLQDPKIAHCLHATSAPCTAPDNVGIAPTYLDTVNETGLTTLMSVRLSIAGSTTGSEHVNVLAYSALQSPPLPAPLAPDAIELVGNFTTADEFTASIDQGVGSLATCAGGARIYLETKDPAVIRMMYTRSGVYDAAAAKAALVAAFSPVFDTAADKAPRFGIRVSDSSVSHYQFATICNAAGAIGIEPSQAPPLGTGLPRPYVDTLHALMTQDLGIGGVTPGQGAASNVVVNPVQAVRWEITQRSKYADATTSTKGTLIETPGVEALSTARFELIRTWVPFDHAPFSNVSAACPNCLELVGEFPVDLKFGFSILPPGAAITAYNLDDAATTPTPATIAPAATNLGVPQQIRSISFKLGTRTAMSDRDFNLGGASPGFIFRYRINAKEVARVRETMEEVFLQNQTNMNY